MTLAQNPLFSDDNKPDDKPPEPAGYVLPSKAGRIEPLRNENELRSGADNGVNQAVNLIKEKLARLYDEGEPDAQREAKEAKTAAVRTPHQQFMYDLTTSGKSLAEIQTEWHNYYINLPDDQKHQVWQEFYDSNETGNFYQPHTADKQVPAHKTAPKAHEGGVVVANHMSVPAKSNQRPARQIRQGVRHKVTQRAVAVGRRHKQNLHSLLFGLATGSVVLLIFMFGFFNEVIIAPFIQPGRANATPIIVDNNSVAASGEPKVIIPKINVEIPVIYDIPSNEESVIQNNLEDGVVHYPSTELPGQKGNVAVFGHSSNNIFNKGKYKFAFVLLHELRTGDTFYLTYNKQVYAYKVFLRKVVDPSEVTVLNDIPGQTATATLITCDPPGTSRHRLVVVGEQISPDPARNIASTATPTPSNATTQLTGNGPTLWSRFWNWLF